VNELNKVSHLRDILADLYPVAANARRVVSDARLSARLIDFGGAAIDFWHSIVQQAENANRLYALVRIALKEYPENTSLHWAWTEYVGSPLSGRFADGQFAEVIDRLGGTTKLLPWVEQHLPGVRAILQNARQQIRPLAEYKNIHDLLQQLESDYGVIFIELYEDDILLSVENIRWSGLGRNCSRLLITLDRLCHSAATVSFADDVADWCEDLTLVSTAFYNALKQRDVEQLDHLMNELYSVISTQTSRMNDRMIERAHALPLGDLVQMLADLHADMLNTNEALPETSTQQIKIFGEDVAVLAQLEIELLTLRDEHDRCQQIHNEFRLEQPNLARNLQRFQRRWLKARGLKIKLEGLRANQNEDWANHLHSSIQQLDGALEQQNITHVRGAFEACLSIMLRRFNQVDYDFHRLCMLLNEAGGPLDKLLETLT